MAKKRQETSSSDQPPEKPVKKKPVKKRAAGELPWHPAWRCLLSLLIVLHLAAVFSAPWALSTAPALPPGFDAMQPPQPLPPPNSPVWQQPVIARGMHQFFHHYLNLLYLNHGYEFFAPDPAGTHVIDYEVTQAAGEPVKGRIPSHDLHWPRLLYHRHMMLSEQTQMPAMGPQSGKHYAEHLATLYKGNSKLGLKVHLLLPPHRVAEDTPLDAPSTFQLIGEVEGTPRQPAETVAPAPTEGVQQ